MRTEYLLTEEQKEELADIDRQIVELCKRKNEIYLHANCRYIMDKPDEIEAIFQYKDTWGLPVIQNQGVIKIKGEDREDE